MVMKKQWILTALAMVSVALARSQRVLTEGHVVYQLAVVGQGASPSVAGAFNGAKQTVWFKGQWARTDFVSPMLSQSTFFDGSKRVGAVLKETGPEKYVTVLDSTQWKHYHRKYDHLAYQLLSDTAHIAGYVCKKAVGASPNGLEVTVYYTPDLKPYNSHYEPLFATLPGLVLMYEVQSAGALVRYTATTVAFASVNFNRFDLPKTGYKLLAYNP
jgi:hypothetical protein